jgi:hypothetical protein
MVNAPPDGWGPAFEIATAASWPMALIQAGAI